MLRVKELIVGIQKYFRVLELSFSWCRRLKPSPLCFHVWLVRLQNNVFSKGLSCCVWRNQCAWFEKENCYSIVIKENWTPKNNGAFKLWKNVSTARTSIYPNFPFIYQLRNVGELLLYALLAWFSTSTSVQCQSYANGAVSAEHMLHISLN